MPRLAVLAALAAAGALGAAFAFGGGSTPTSFRLPDASAACRVDGARLVCANLRSPAALSLPARGEPHAVPAKVWWDASAPVVGRWSHGGLACTAHGHAIVCRNATGAAITVGPARLAVGA
jgi:hypothetical protein